MFRYCMLLLFASCVAQKNGTLRSDIRFRRQAETQCVLPAYQANGDYTVGGVPNARPGQRYAAVTLTFRCQGGFGLSGNDVLFCVSNVWSHPTPKCLRTCRLFSHPSVRYRCVTNGGDTEEYSYRECEKNEVTGTSVKPQCKPEYTYPGFLTHMYCNEGRWSYVAICQPVCGTVTPEGTALIIDGEKAKRGEFPWHAGIYRKSTTQNGMEHKLICGGSLVSESVVITAAHCFWSSNGLQPPQIYSIALGKLYSEWDNPLDEGAQKFDVLSIKVPIRYQGVDARYQEDIAAARLSSPVHLKPYIRPVCLDFDAGFDRIQLAEGSMGKVAGWGLIDITGRAASLLSVLTVPYVNTQQCIEEAPPEFRPYITGDKICAGWTNGSALCRGDSGGGLVFASHERGETRYYLRGVVSTAPDSNAQCNVRARTTFTQVFKHKSFIEKNTQTIIYTETTVQQLPVPAVLQRPTEQQERPAVQQQRPAVQQPRPTVQQPQAQCTLPPYPANGRYTISGSNAAPGQRISSGTIRVTCNSGFSKDSAILPSCSNGQWSAGMPQCVSSNLECKLPPLWDSTYRCRADITGDTKSWTCRLSEPAGTVAKFDCTRWGNGKNNLNPTDIAQCVDGRWDGDTTCSVGNICGQAAEGGSELPWVASVYNSQNKEFLCTGTIINPVIILTTRPCVWDKESNAARSADNYVVTAGSLYPQWDDQRDRANRQVIEVREIDTRSGPGFVFLALRKSLQYNTFVRPICIDELSQSKLRGNVKDVNLKTGSWRMLDESGSIAIEKGRLQTMTVKLIERQQCLRELRPVYHKYLTSDKSCFRDIEGQGLCRGDGGMGLYYSSAGRYYIAGLATAGLSTAICSASDPIAYTLLINNAP